MPRQVKDWIEGWMKYTENTEPPPIYRRWSAISAIASVMQRKCSISIGLETWFPNLYVVLVGDSGVKKSTAMRPARKLLERTGVELAAEAVTREGLIRRLKRSGINPRYDASRKAMCMDSSLTVHSSEFAVFLNRNNNQLLDDLSDWYDCADHWKYEPKTKELVDEITNVWVNIIGATTPTLLQSLLPIEAIGGGLTSRILFIFANKENGKLVPMHFKTPEESELEEMLFEDLDNIKLLSGDFQMTEDFVDKWIEWSIYQDQNPPFQDPRFAGYITRRRVHVIKLCMVLHISYSNEFILTGKDLENSIELLENTETKMPLSLRGVGRSDSAMIIDQLMRLISNKKVIRFGEVVRRMYHDADEFTLKKAIVALESMKFCKVEQSGKDIIITFLMEVN